MSEADDFDPASTPTIEVHVYSDGVRLVSELCESEEDAADVVARWSELPGVECVVEDLSTRHGDEEVLFEPEPVDDQSDQYAEGP